MQIGVARIQYFGTPCPSLIVQAASDQNVLLRLDVVYRLWNEAFRLPKTLKTVAH